MSLLRTRCASVSPDTSDEAEPPQQKTHLARPGDVVIIQEKYDALKPITLQRDAVVNNRYGRFAHNDMLDRALGRRIKSRSAAATGRQSSAGFVHALAPTPELWSQAMDHRTQIVYPHDAALIALLLDLRPGATLVESGTGSGSASAAFARVLAPAGRLFTFEFHAERAAAAAADFARLGIDHIVSVSPAVDVVKNGFVGVPDGAADAVFLDLPVPYAMGREVRRVLRPDGAACFFSPCVEQVQRTCEMLRRSGFHSIRTVTAPVKTYETREMRLQTPGFDELRSKPHQPISAGAANGNPATSATAVTAAHPATREEEPSAASGVSADEPNADPDASSPREAVKKRRRTENGPKPVSEKELKSRTRTAGAERLAVGNIDGAQAHVGRVMRPKVPLHSKPYSIMKGHTSYLTFARRAQGGPSNSNGVKAPANGAAHPVEGQSAQASSCGMT